MRRGCYSSDLTDEQWVLVAPHIPSARSGGRPRTTDVRAVLDAILYLLRTGCQWRQFPRDFPPGRRCTATSEIGACLVSGYCCIVRRIRWLAWRRVGSQIRRLSSWTASR